MAALALLYADEVTEPNSIPLTTTVVPIKLLLTISAFKFAVLNVGSEIIRLLFASSSGTYPLNKYHSFVPESLMNPV